MKATHRSYDRARRQLLDARGALPGPFRQAEDEELPPAVAAVVAAEAALRAAEETVADELQSAWDRNRQAVVDAKTAIAAARRNQARVETECGLVARTRDRRDPVLNEVERATVNAARTRVDEALAAHEQASAIFKAGVTADQLAEA